VRLSKYGAIIEHIDRGNEIRTSVVIARQGIQSTAPPTLRVRMRGGER
jgi:hypothetical protein